MALHSPEIRSHSRKPKRRAKQGRINSRTGAFQVRTVAVYGEHPASKFKSLMELPNDFGLDNIANQSKT